MAPYPEFDAWRWERLERVLPFRRKAYVQVARLRGLRPISDQFWWADRV
jgi:hypothetical protein